MFYLQKEQLEIKKTASRTQKNENKTSEIK